MLHLFNKGDKPIKLLQSKEEVVCCTLVEMHSLLK